MATVAQVEYHHGRDLIGAESGDAQQLANQAFVM
jgi:hypothetical protein